MTSSLNILHVDDEPDIREVTAMSLSLDVDVVLTSTASGAEALSLLKNGLRADVILLDVMMPTLDGPRTLVALRKLPDHERTPVIFMTARVQSSEVGRYIALGAVGVIVKPFDPMTLAASVRAVLADPE